MTLNTDKLKEYLLENTDDLREIVSSIECYNGNLEEYRVFNNDEETFHMFFGEEIMKAVEAVCNGEYNINDDLLRFDRLGNLESLNEHDYEQELIENIDEIIDAMENVPPKEFKHVIDISDFENMSFTCNHCLDNNESSEWMETTESEYDGKIVDIEEYYDVEGYVFICPNCGEHCHTGKEEIEEY